MILVGSVVEPKVFLEIFDAADCEHLILQQTLPDLLIILTETFAFIIFT